MDRISGTNYDLVGGKRMFKDRTPTASGTFSNKLWMNGVQENILGLIEALGLTPSDADWTLMFQAVRMMAGGGYTSLTASASLTAAAAGLVAISAASGSATLSLPLANAANGKPTRYTIARTDNTGNTVTIQLAGSDTWLLGGGSASITLGPLQSVTLHSDGVSHWLMNAGGRRKVSGAVTLYVASTGSDTANSGLTSGSPLLTVNAALKLLATVFDHNGTSPIIQLADATYGAIAISQPLVGAPGLALVGNTGTPSNVVLSTSTGGTLQITSPLQVALSGLKIQASGTPVGGSLTGNGITASFGAVVSLAGPVVFGACTSSAVQTATGAVFQTAGQAYTIAGGGIYHLLASPGGFIQTVGSTVTLTGTPAFSGAFAQSDGPSRIETASTTFSGSATGVRYGAANNGVINTNGGGASYLPGNSAGSTSNGGVYV